MAFKEINEGAGKEPQRMHGWEKGRRLMRRKKMDQEEGSDERGEVGKWGSRWNRRGWGHRTRTGPRGFRDVVSLGSSLLHLSLLPMFALSATKPNSPQPSSPPQLDTPLSPPLTHLCLPYPGSVIPRLPSCVLRHFVLLPKFSPAPRGPSKFWPSFEDPCKPPAP